MKKVLNLYAGLGGNRKHWKNVQVTAVEMQSDIADAYMAAYPADNIHRGDAHQYLLDHFQEFDFVWSSPPCQRNSKMERANSRNQARYPDLRLYEEVIFLKTYFKGLFVVENVVPYYKPLIEPTQRIGRHLFWSNFDFLAVDVDRPAGFISSGSQATANQLKAWLGINYEGSLYYGKNHCPAQILRNCVHPEIGRQIFDQAMKL